MNLISTDVYTGVMGLAASMGAVISTNGKKGHRYALKNSKIMMHQPLTGIDFAQATDIAIVNKEIQDLKKDLYEILATNTGQNIETIYKDCERDF
jgi:ATP-dependent Clp protease protease subunit